MTTAFPIKPKFEKASPYVYIFLIYSSFEHHFATATAKNTMHKLNKKLIMNNLHAVSNFSTVKFEIKVPKTKAGTNRLFSNFDKTVAEFSGIAFSFATTNPRKINEKRTIICPIVVVNILISFLSP